MTDRLPESVLPLSTHDNNRVRLFLGDAEELIRDEFDEEDRDLDAEIADIPRLGRTVIRVVREMVATSVIVGDNINVRSASSTTGPQSDSVTFADVGLVDFAGPRLTEGMRRKLGLGRSRATFPPPPRWPERRLR
ncbi:phage Gp19/Gp15/Gp42 family protein [Corynebacterium sp. YIM 101645]|uniref:Phage Gp19/Gp15/Gp42 family protein n=1 Tax=Corynebacterium lemuris TaxID=1859292 RepID=A0ABT2FXF0_9CORY|nr:phage Gp19/Gp15/Gp42 family protein [Corynebacterium lemuris]